MKKQLHPVEIEVKFFVKEPETVKKRLKEIGARFQGSVFETNLRFEDREETLIQRNALLRLRQDGKTRLTFKSEPDAFDDDYKIFNELEVEVSDFGAMQRILKAIGFHVAQIYEKKRETYTHDGAEIVLDVMPFGNFVEIEGPRETIRALASRLFFQWERRILTNYLAIFDMVRRREHLPFTDVTFANFTRYPVDIERYLDIIEEKSRRRMTDR